MISKDTIQKIEDAADIISVVSDFVRLKKQGSGYIAPCPFHGEKTASFHVSASKNVYKCFGCGVGGNNAVSFVMAHEKYTYPEALRYLANKFGIEVEEEAMSEQAKLALSSKEEIFLSNFQAQNAFSENLKSNKVVLQYLKDRQLTEETIQKFNIGYAPDDYRWLFQKLTSIGISKDVIFKCDLAYDYKGKIMDRFRHRVVFPIHNIAGKVIGFGGRVIEKDSPLAKYVNTSENEVYQKRDTVYGLYQAKKAISTLDVCHLVEGYMDVASLHQEGIENTVASSGTALTLSQIKAIKRYTTNLLILYDADAAGLKAAARGLEIAIEEGMNVKIVSFPAGEDPDSFVHAYGAEAFKEYVESNRSDIIDFFFRDWSSLSPEAKDETGVTILRLIAKIPTDRSFTIQSYIEKLSKFFNSPMSSVTQRVDKVRATLQSGSADAVIAPIKEIKKEDSRELDFIKTLLLYGNLPFNDTIGCYYYMMERSGVIEDFKNSTARLIFSAYYSMLEEGIVPDLDLFLQHSNPEISNFAMDITLDALKVSDSWNADGLVPQKDYRETVVNVTGYFRIYKLKEKIQETQKEISTATSSDIIAECFQKDSDYKKLLRKECLVLGIKTI